jgi:hypothetical protein
MQTEELTKAETVYRAVKYVLDRIQDSPNVYYYCGPGTQIFLELIRAESAFKERPLAEIEKERKQDMEPSYRKTRPRVLDLEDRLTEARRNCTCGGAHI